MRPRVVATVQTAADKQFPEADDRVQVCAILSHPNNSRIQEAIGKFLLRERFDKSRINQVGLAR